MTGAATEQGSGEHRAPLPLHRRAAELTTLALLVVVPALRLPWPAALEWSERLRSGALGGIVVLGLAMMWLSRGGRGLGASPIVVRGGLLLAVLLLASLQARSSAIGLSECVRIGLLLGASLLAALAAGANPGFARRALRALLGGSLLSVLFQALPGAQLGVLGAAGLVASLAASRGARGDRVLSLGFALLLLVSASPPAWGVGYGGALILWWRRAPIAAARSRWAIPLAALLLAGSSVLLVGWLAPDRVPDAGRIARAVELRGEGVRVAVALARMRPLLGHGPGSFPAEAQGHPLATRSLSGAGCDPLQVLAEAGPLGVLAFGALLLSGWRSAGLATLVLLGLVEGVLPATATALVLFVTLGLARPIREQPAPAEDAPARLHLLAACLAFALAGIVALGPALAAISLWRMNAAWLGRDFDAVVVEGLRARRFDPSRAEPFLRLAEVYLLAGDFHEALIQARRGIALRPGDATLRLRAAQAAYFIGDRALAGSEIERAVSLGPASSEAREWQRRVNTRPAAPARLPTPTPTLTPTP